MTGWSNQRPNGAVYQKTYENIGKYSKVSGKPYINPDIPMYVPGDGDCAVRIVDPIELLALGTYFLDVHFHRDVGFAKDYFLCTLEMAPIAALIGYPQGAGPCYRCEQRTSDLWDNDPELAKSYLSDHRRLMWVLDLKNPAEAGMLKLWSCPRTLSDEILSQSHEPELNVFKDICHPETGVPIYFKRTGKGRNTKYSGVKLGTRPYPVGIEIAEQRFQFKDILIWPEPGEVQASAEFANSAAADLSARGDTPPIEAYENDPALPPAVETAVSTPPAGGAVAGDELDYSELDALPDDLKECFRKFYDQYQECEACPVMNSCSQPWPVKKKPLRTPKPAPPAAAAKPSRTTGAPAGGGPVNRAAGTSRTTTGVPGAALPPDADATAKIKAAKERIQAQIEARKNKQ